MAGRMYTRTGDRGETSLADGTRVPKDAARVEAFGTIEEANAWVGAARAFTGDPQLGEALAFLQHRLLNGSARLAAPGGGSPAAPGLTEDDVAFLEASIDRFEAATGRLRAFVLPGGGRAGALLHVACTVCRRAERRIVTLGASEPVDAIVLKFVNRASDFLFAAARYANHLAGAGEVPWDRGAPAP